MNLLAVALAETNYAFQFFSINIAIILGYLAIGCYLREVAKELKRLRQKDDSE